MNGSIEVHYDGNELLNTIFFRAQLTAETLTWFKARISVTMDALEANFEKTTVKIEEKEFEVSFDDFKREYPYSRNMHLVAPMWPKMRTGEQYQIFISCPAYRRYCDRNKAWYKPMLPEKYIKTKQYLNHWDKL